MHRDEHVFFANLKRTLLSEAKRERSGEQLIPVTVNLDQDGKKFQDQFLYNIYGKI